MRLRSLILLLLAHGAYSRGRVLRKLANSHYSVRGRGPFVCDGPEDNRANCTRCAPGWLGHSCTLPVAVSPCTIQQCVDLTRRGCQAGALSRSTLLAVAL
jgi:hypothetical protein